VKRMWLVVVTLLAGIGTVCYPVISNHLALRGASEAIQAYADAVSVLDAAALEAEWAAAEAYNQSLTGSPVHDPFLAGSGMAMAEDYRSVLNLGGAMGYLEIPRIRVHLPILHGTGEAALTRGVGHLEGSTLPVGGAPRHAVLTGHTGLSRAKLLTDLVELREGDEFYVHVLGDVLAYRVVAISVIEPSDTSQLGRFAGRDYVSLLTCTPYGVNSHRLLVRGERVPYVPEVRAGVVPVTASTTDQLARRAAAVTAAVMAGLIVVVLVARSRREARYQARRGLA